jgi:hypothetical protein
MRSWRSLIDPGGRLSRSLDRLRLTLDAIGTRLRKAAAAAVGDTVASVVRTTVRDLLDDPPTYPAPPDRSLSPAQPPWGRSDELDEMPWFDEPDPYSSPDHRGHRPPASAGDPAEPSRWPRALAHGVHATLAWLRRHDRPVLTAVVVGLLTALATYAGGPWAAVVVGLGGSALNLLTFAEAVHAIASAMAAFGCS